MKKIIYTLLILSGSLSLYAQTVTTSNAAVFDGENGANNILKLGLPTNGGVLQFSSNLNNGNESISFDIYGANGSGMNYNFGGGNGWETSSFNLTDRNSTTNGYFGVYDLPGKAFLTLPKPSSQLIVGDYIDFASNSKLIVRSGDSFFDGNVGIGTESHIDTNDNNQEYKLSVDGRIRAHAVKVYTTWADYVFEKDYNLPTLEEVEKHIEEKGHLKDIPSAKEVEANGIDVGEMNKLLLQKIEELTLYTIEQQKQINELSVIIKNKSND